MRVFEQTGQPRCGLKALEATRELPAADRRSKSGWAHLGSLGLSRGHKLSRASSTIPPSLLCLRLPSVEHDNVKQARRRTKTTAQDGLVVAAARPTARLGTSPLARPTSILGFVARTWSIQRPGQHSARRTTRRRREVVE